MSDLDSEKSTDSISEQANPLSDQQTQMCKEYALHTSSSDVEAPAEIDPFSKELLPGALIASPEQNLAQSDEVVRDQQDGFTPEHFLESSLLLEHEAANHSEIQQYPEPVETATQENQFPSGFTFGGSYQAPLDATSTQPLQPRSSNLEPETELDPQLEHISSPELPPIQASEAFVLQQSASNMVSGKWAPLIYGRTYEIDFRFLVVPHNFDEELKNKIWEFIKISTRSPENLPGKPRWIFLKTERRCIIGVTCLVRDLLGFPGEGSEDLIRDRHGRLLYTFVGFVSEAVVPSAIPAMNLDLFADPYRDLVPQKWREKYFGKSQQEISQSLPSQYSKQFRLEEQLRFDPTRPRIPLEHLFPEREDSIVFWNMEDANNILFSASQSSHPIYLCMGNLSRRELLDSRFMCAVLEETSFRQEIEKLRQPFPKPGNTSESTSIKQVKPISKDSQSRETRQPVNDLNVHPQSDKKGGEEISIIGMFVDTIRSVQEGLESVIDQITGMEEAELRSYERKVIDTCNAYVDDLKLLVAEVEDLMRQKRYAEAKEKERDIARRQDKINQINSLLWKVQQRLNYIRRPHVSQSEQIDIQPQRDPLLGFKKKDKPMKERLSENEQDTQKPGDPWQL